MRALEMFPSSTLSLQASGFQTGRWNTWPQWRTPGRCPAWHSVEKTRCLRWSWERDMESRCARGVDEEENAAISDSAAGFLFRCSRGVEVRVVAVGRTESDMIGWSGLSP